MKKSMKFLLVTAIMFVAIMNITRTTDDKDNVGGTYRTEVLYDGSFA